MYPQSIVDLADQKAKGSAALYTLEREFQKHSMNLWDVFPRDFVLSEIRFCIKKGTGPTLCRCGNVVKNSRQNPELAAKKLAACGVKPRPKVGSDGQSGDVLGA